MSLSLCLCLTLSLCGVRLDLLASSGCGSAPCLPAPGLSQYWITGSHARSQTARRPDQLLHSFQRRRRPSASDWLSAAVRELSHGQRVLTAGQPLLITTGTYRGGGERQERTERPLDHCQSSSKILYVLENLSPKRLNERINLFFTLLTLTQLPPSSEGGAINTVLIITDGHIFILMHLKASSFDLYLSLGGKLHIC